MARRSREHIPSPSVFLPTILNWQCGASPRAAAPMLYPLEGITHTWMRVVVRGRMDARLSDSFATAVFRELRELLGFAGLTRWRVYSTTVNLLVVLAFGIVVPWRRGIEFFDPILLLLY